MQLICLGDVAVTQPVPSQAGWVFPGGSGPSNEVKVLFNMELPLADHVNPTPRTSGPRIIADPSVIQRIRRWSPSFVSLATNHILDGGEEGLAGTISALRGEGFDTVGGGMAQEEIARPLIWETSQGKLAVVNWVFSETHPDWMRVPGPNCWPGMPIAQKSIRDLKDRVDWVMVLAHWSDESFSYPRVEDREIARGLIEAGADILIGHHPHVVRGMEIIAGKPVFYSLGNFYFSDTREKQGDVVFHPAPRNREALAVRLTMVRNQAPVCEPLSFWQDANQTKPDKLHRAVRRMKRTTLPLIRYSESEYAHWYQKERVFFDRWEYRICFSIYKKGLAGMINHFLSVLKKRSVFQRY